MEEKDLRGRIVTMKLGTVRDIPVLRQRRLFGLDLELLKRTPAGLPQREDFYYFKIEKEGPYWSNVVRDRNVALSDALDPKLKFSLYIITKPGS
jgi:predicted component of type VI protein secretion system